MSRSESHYEVGKHGGKDIVCGRVVIVFHDGAYRIPGGSCVVNESKALRIAKRLAGEVENV